MPGVLIGRTRSKWIDLNRPLVLAKIVDGGVLVLTQLVRRQHGAVIVLTLLSCILIPGVTGDELQVYLGFLVVLAPEVAEVGVVLPYIAQEFFIPGCRLFADWFRIGHLLDSPRHGLFLGAAIIIAIDHALVLPLGWHRRHILAHNLLR